VARCCKLPPAKAEPGPGGRTIRVPVGRVDENTLVSHYQPRHTFPNMAPPPSHRARAVGAAAAGAGVLVIAAAILVASLPGSSPVPGGAVATSLQGAALKNGPRVHTRGRSSGGAPATGARAGPHATMANRAAAAGPAINLAVPAGFGPSLRKAWVAADPGRSGLAAADIAATLAGSVFYAEQASIGTYWAISRFVPSPLLEQTASSRVGKAMLAQFSSVSVFAKTRGHAWRYVGGFAPGSCPTDLPSSVSTAWSLCSVGS
jgi:hypothetical protein